MNILKTKYGSWFIEVRPTPNHPYQIIVNPAYYEEIKGFLDRGGFTAENNQTVKAEQRKDVREALEKKELETTIEANLTDKDALNLSKVSIGISLVAIIVSILISKC